MNKRFVSIGFRYLKSDWATIRKKELGSIPFVLTAVDHGRKVIVAANPLAHAGGIRPGMVLADAKILVRNLEVLYDDPAIAEKVLSRLANWCIRFTPAVMLDEPDGLLLDATGCAHLWGGEEKYLGDILARLRGFGFQVHGAMADTIGGAWAAARFAKSPVVVPPGEQISALLPLPAAALRLDEYTCERLHKLGLRQIKDFVGMPRSSLRRRFGDDCIRKINYALGHEAEIRPLVFSPEPWQERLSCLEPILTLTGIEIALEKLLDALCSRLCREGKGLRIATFKGYRIDGKMVSVSIGTNRPSHNETHLFKLISLKFENFEPGPGIELFTLDAPKVEDAIAAQSGLWNSTSGLQDPKLAELLDRLTTRFGEGHFHRYLPDEHYWPERSVKKALSLTEKPTTPWTLDRPRPLYLLPQPEPITVTAPIPDYPPMNFRYKGKLHKVIKADGPERIEQEWWLQTGEHRDYYCVEDEKGHRYWVFRLGHYQINGQVTWFLHGYFA
ncbi:protein ImuB [Hydrobacter penzbergensis]|uniref:Protein ImuB n=1 Tax=Hydrobacter penzbergensis TaxID=1235997 RepID=A0A8X8LBK7_9BACT|nr:DNA polymerase Y family protein [Hydrobacter penzbergensis]SDX00126.1 protein ImuB [Hydrobacter penzbergensis]